MKTTELTAKVREQVGKKIAKQLRKEGLVPGVVYDNSKATHITLNVKDLKKSLYTADTYIVKLNVGGSVMDTIIREAQFHPVKEYVQHVEFLRVSDDKPVELTLPVKFVGTPVGVSQGGKLVTKLRRLKVKGIVSQLPEAVEIDVTDLNLGSTIKVSAAKADGIEIITSPTAAVASVEIPRALRSAGAEGEEGEEGIAAEEGETTEE